jgi:LysR family glycine cleavage system transcriptional activator
MQKSLTPSMLAWLRSFEATARHGSVTHAAEELCVTQGAVSQQIKHLERALGLALFTRRSNKADLTLEGRKLAAVVDPAFSSIRDMLTDMAKPGGLIPVTLSCSPSFAIRWLAPRLSRLSGHQASLDLRVFGEFHALDRGRMAAEVLEAAIRYDASAYEDLTALTFLDEYLLPVASPSFLEQHPAMRSRTEWDGKLLLHDLRPWYGAPEDEEWRTYLDGAGLGVRDMRHGKRFNLSELAISAALAGEGVAIGRLALVLEDLESGRLAPVLPMAVRATASYKFISTRTCPPKILAIGDRLEDEGRRFGQRRDAFLLALAAGR